MNPHYFNKKKRKRCPHWAHLLDVRSSAIVTKYFLKNIYYFFCFVCSYFCLALKLFRSELEGNTFVGVPVKRHQTKLDRDFKHLVEMCRYRNNMSFPFCFSFFSFALLDPAALVTRQQSYQSLFNTAY